MKVLVRKYAKWFVGTIENGKLIKDKEIRNQKLYKSRYDAVKWSKIDKKLDPKNFGFDSLFVLNEKIEESKQESVPVKKGRGRPKGSKNKIKKDEPPKSKKVENNLEIYENMTDRKKEKKFEQWWWKSLNPKCKNCSKSCKQSSKVDLIVCPFYEKAA